MNEFIENKRDKSQSVSQRDSQQCRSRYILAIDSSSDMLAIAVGAQKTQSSDTSSECASLKLLATRDHMCRRKANVELTKSCLEAIADAGLSPQDIDAVLVGKGPGSFTGVRIGIASAKGLACGLECKLLAASTLDGVAWHAWKGGLRGYVGVVADAMRKEVYPGIYKLDETGASRCFEAETVQKAELCVESWLKHPYADQLILCGDGLRKYRTLFEAAGFSSYAPEDLWFVSGEGLLYAGAYELSALETKSSSKHVQTSVKDLYRGDPAFVLPLYTRLSDAEENERKKLGIALPKKVKLSGVDSELAGIHCQMRPLSVNDLEMIEALEKEAYTGTSHTPWSKKLFYEDLTQEGRSWWVAHDQGKIIAFAGGYRAGADFEIEDVVVAKDYRQKHIASRLIERLATDAQMFGANALLLEVASANRAALSCYFSLGFKQCGERPKYYNNKEDALILKALLPLELNQSDTKQGETEQNSLFPTHLWPPCDTNRTAQASSAIREASPLILAIESSCDETAMAVIDGTGTICASVVATQIDFHARFGGVVPEIASRKHTEAIVGVYEEVLMRAGEHFGCKTLSIHDLAAVAVTAGPGLVGALVVGVAFAKGLCAAADLPLIPVNHLEGHLFANLFETPDLRPPFVTSLVSGGNTLLVYVQSWGSYEVLGATIDDAVGEAFDKVAKALGLGYPGGPVISRLGAKGNPKAIHFPRAMMHSHDLRFSLSGLKTAVITYIEGENKAGRPVNLPDLAASFEAAVIDVQVAKAVMAVEQTGVKEFCVGGGVAANPALRRAYQETFSKMGVRVTVPPLAVCGDNAAMIAAVALRNYKQKLFAPLTLDADPNAKLGSWSCSGEPLIASKWPCK